jgi:glycosyltransferase involved in cell wall biosynthesis
MVAWTPDIFEWYSAADACILLSWYDACSRVVLEAVRWGLPCITTRFNGAAEILQSSGGGVVVDSPRDQGGVLAALDAMQDPERRLAFSRACIAAGERLSMDRHVDGLLKAYTCARLPSQPKEEC